MSVIIEFLIWYFLYISNLFHSRERPSFCTDLIVSRRGLVEEQLENELATKLYFRFLFIFVLFLRNLVSTTKATELFSKER